MSFFTDGLKSLEEQRLAHMADSATYSRKNASADVLVTSGTSAFRTEDDNGFSIVLHTHDFIFAASEIASIGEPKRGDRITYNGFVHEVLNPNNEPCWAWSDEAKTVYRVHTKQIGSVS